MARAQIEGRVLIYGGFPPYTAQVSAGALPVGLDLELTGRYIAFPGEFEFDQPVDITLQVTSANELTSTLRFYANADVDALKISGDYFDLPYLIPSGVLTIEQLDLPSEMPQ